MEEKEITVTISPSVLIVVLAIITAGSFLLYKAISGGANAANQTDSGSSNTVSVVDGKQIVEVTVQGGYSPRNISAKANIPTILRMKSQGSYGCERSFRIAKLGISEVLDADGIKDIDLGTQTTGSRIIGTCGMGMYSVTINFN